MRDHALARFSNTSCGSTHAESTTWVRDCSAGTSTADSSTPGLACPARRRRPGRPLPRRPPSAALQDRLPQEPVRALLLPPPLFFRAAEATAPCRFCEKLPLPATRPQKRLRPGCRAGPRSFMSMDQHVSIYDTCLSFPGKTTHRTTIRVISFRGKTRIDVQYVFIPFQGSTRVDLCRCVR